MRYLMILALLFSLPALARTDFVIAGQAVAPGTRLSFFLPATTTEVPVTVFHGSQPGPVLTLTAGIHGDEFPSILALQRLRSQLDPAKMSGTLVLVHLANLSGFHGRRIALNPLDEKNLNREFPGDPAGTPTEQLAHIFTTEIIRVTDYLIDLHSGSANQTLLPHVYSPVLYDTALDARTLAFARATGLADIVLYDERPNDPDNAISYPNTAQTRGKPALTLEVGHLGERDEIHVERVIAACLNAMRHLGILPGSAPAVVDGERLYRRLVSVASPVTGLFVPQASVGDAVEAGTRLGVVTDYFGEWQAEVRSPAAGILLMLNETPPIKAGETPATIGILP